MRTFSGPVKALLSNSEVAVFFLVSYGSANFTSMPYDVTIDGLTYVYENAGTFLMNVEPPVMTSTLDKASYKLVFSDPNFSFRTGTLSGTVGLPVKVKMGVFNTNKIPIYDTGSTLRGTGEPLLHKDDVFTIYAGYSNSQSYSVDFNGAAVFTVECSSPFGRIDSTKAYYTSKGFLGTKYENGSTDSSYDKVFEGNTETRIKWGKA